MTLEEWLRQHDCYLLVGFKRKLNTLDKKQQQFVNFFAYIKEEEGPFYTPCWIWVGPVNSSTGYGYCGSGYPEILAHRMAYRYIFGRIPKGQVVRHKEDHNRKCCNPYHLQLGSHADNMADAAIIGKQKGENNHGATIHENVAAEIKWLVQNYAMPLRNIAEKYDVSRSIVQQIKAGNNWAWLDPVKPSWYQPLKRRV